MSQDVHASLDIFTLMLLSFILGGLLWAMQNSVEVHVDPDTGCEYLAVGFGAVMRYDETGRNVRGCREGAAERLSRD